MEKLIIEPTFNNPKVIFNPEEDYYEISGKSLPENVNEVYIPIFNWIHENIEKIKNKIELNIKLGYINTASSKMIMELMIMLDKHNKKNDNILINWFYEEDDDYMKEVGEDFAGVINLPFNICSITNM